MKNEKLMEAYTGFAYVYNKFMADMPYSQWAEFIKEKFIQNGVLPGDSQIADLGCGTGVFSIELAKAGYSVVGIDKSQDMLAEASEALYDEEDIFENAGDNGLNIVYSLQDMTEFEMPYQMDGIVSVCDSMNYLADDGELEKCFRASWKALRQNGVFIFDMKKEEFYREVLADNTFADCMDDCAYIWDNQYDEKSRINEYYLTFFISDSEGMYERFDEYHIQRAYPEDYVIKKLSDAGFINIDTFEKEAGEDNSERIYFIAVKP